MICRLLYLKPNDPKEFLIESLQKLKVNGLESIFINEDITKLFDMIDVDKSKNIDK